MLGNVLNYWLTNRSQGSTHFFSYIYRLGSSYQQETVLGGGSGGQGEQRLSYDVNGHLVKLTDLQNAADNRRFVVDAQGNILARADNLADNLDASTALTRSALDAAGAGTAQLRHHLLADGHTVGIHAAAIGTAAAVSVFNFNAASLGKEAISGALRRYTVASGDTLRSIAQGVYGDSNLWYLIADANGLAADDPLVPGSSLILPDGASNANTSQIYKPWDTAHTVGDTSPTLPMPPANAGGCGGVGMAMMIIVAIAVTVLTAGAGAIVASSATGSGLSTLGAASVADIATAGASALSGGAIGGSTIAVGAGTAGATSVTIGTGTAIGASVVGGAVGSIASQGLAIGTGMQDQFSWRQVGMSALTAGVGSGVGAAITQMGITAQLNGLMPSAIPPSAAQTATASIQAIGSNAITQQSLRLAGLQDQFSWRQVAAAAAGGAIGSGMGNGGGFSGDLLSGFASGIGAGLVAGRGKVDGWSAFGNAFGQAFAGSLGGSPTGGQGQGETQLARELRDNWNAMAGRTQLANVSEGPLLPLMVGTADGDDGATEMMRQLWNSAAPAGAGNLPEYELLAGPTMLVPRTPRTSTAGLVAESGFGSSLRMLNKTYTPGEQAALTQMGRATRGMTAFALAGMAGLEFAPASGVLGLEGGSAAWSLASAGGRWAAGVASDLWYLGPVGAYYANSNSLNNLTTFAAEIGLGWDAAAPSPLAGLSSSGRYSLRSQWGAVGDLKLGGTVAGRWVAQSNWQGPATNKGAWLGDIGNSSFALTDDAARAVNVPAGTKIKFVEGAPDFSPFAVKTPAGTPGSFAVEGLIYNHAADARTTVQHLAAESGMTPAQIRQWLAQQNVRMHHFRGNIMQLVPEPLHTGVHHTGSRALNK